jgi:hypothetical protein
MKRIIIAVVTLSAVIFGAWIFWPKPDIAPIVVGQIIPPTAKEPNAQTIVAVTLKGIKTQNKIVPMEAQYVAVVTSDETRLGIFHSRKTLVLPASFRYQIDLAKLSDRDLDWDSGKRILHIRLPKVEVDGPTVDLTKAKNYADGMLTSFASVSDSLDERNYRAGREQLIQQARDPAVMKRAQEAASRAVEQTFSMPLRAAGLTCTVEVTFA